MAMKMQTPDRPAPSKEIGPLSQSQRWVRFGSNVALGLVLATVLVVAAVWLSGKALRGTARSDWTAAGRFSLSPRTRTLVADIPSDFDIRLTNLYSHAPEIPASEEQWQRVEDLLSEYAMASPRITAEAVNPDVDVGRVETLVNRLRARYAKELEKPKALVGEFDKLRTDLDAVLKAQADRASAAADAWTTGPTEVVNSLRMVAQRWQQLETVGAFTAASIQSLTDQALPAYATALARAKDFLGPVGDNFEAVPELYKQLGEAAKGADVPAEVGEILASAESTYAPLVERIKAFTKQAADLPELELDKVRDQIGEGNAILIETPTRVQVVSFDDVWVRNRAGGEQEQPERLFAGEQALSSALLGLLHADKPAVLFVTFGEPATMWGGPYAEMAERIRKANFIVEDWNLAREPAMPAPEHMTFPILVLVPPAPPNPQMPMPPPSPELYATAVEAIKKGAAAIVLGEPASMFGPAVPYRDLFDTFGLEGRFEAVAVRKVVVDQRGTERAVPQIEITRYPEHPITAPLGALPTMLVTAMPVMPKAPLPEGVAVQPILTLPVGADYWADTTAMEAMRGEAKRNEVDDLIPTEEQPVVLAAAVTRELATETAKPTAEGEPKPPAEKAERPAGKVQKVVFFGDGDFASDRVAFYRTMFGQQVFPGNAELFLNSLLWVAGTEHLITVSPEALEARRIGDLGGWTLTLRILVIAGLPLAAGIVGLIVYILRRR
jgi:hypothetical protein